MIVIVSTMVVKLKKIVDNGDQRKLPNSCHHRCIVIMSIMIIIIIIFMIMIIIFIIVIMVKGNGQTVVTCWQEELKPSSGAFWPFQRIITDHHLDEVEDYQWSSWSKFTFRQVLLPLKIRLQDHPHCGVVCRPHRTVRQWIALLNTNPTIRKSWFTSKMFEKILLSTIQNFKSPIN